MLVESYSIFVPNRVLSVQVLVEFKDYGLCEGFLVVFIELNQIDRYSIKFDRDSIKLIDTQSN
ncbi:MAG: hypothetical protein DRR08_10040 [Candidatus Parabeggiatoa sp. nov. 2]|nr:MAG: hypothetical protein DRR08_10040 [Gammaproteobacteria bacterium]